MVSILELLSGFIVLTPFTLKLVVGQLSFAAHLRRKERFPLRLICSFLLQLSISVGLMAVFRNIDLWQIQNTLYYCLLFALSAACLKLLFRESMAELIPCAVAGYMTEHISTQVFQLLFQGLLAEVQSERTTMAQYAAFALFQIVVFGAVSGAVWLFFARNATPMTGDPALSRKLLQLSAVTLAVVLGLSSVRDQYAHESYVLMVVTRLFSVFCCLFLLYIRYDILEKNKLSLEQKELRGLVSLERKQFEQSRENIELINIKCHDMRHKMEVWERRGGCVDPDELAEMKQLIRIYDSPVKTGNDILDTILTEHSLYCEKHGIRLSCIADGEKLGFMTTGDICSLFGNAIENAIEAVSLLPDQEDRNISFQVRESRGMLVVTVENYYTGELAVEDGLPRSSKGDDLNHGFGMKSIRSVAEKYGGEMTVLADEMFHLTVLIPIPQ